MISSTAILIIVVIILIAIIGGIYYYRSSYTDKTYKEPVYNDSSRVPTPEQLTAVNGPINGPVSQPVAVSTSGGSGYVFYSNKDSRSGDMYRKKSLANKIDELKAHCSSLPRCKAFNTNGWFKHTLKPQSEWKTIQKFGPSYGLYVKQ